jgi:sterol desaturase/sphingolipid hydroxylase (fatty acid hydroxylase superfamily)
MKFVSTLLDYILWPAIFAGALGITYVGYSHGHEVYGFLVAYLCVALSLFILERARPHERQWLRKDGQMAPDLAHTLLTKVMVEVCIITLTTVGIMKGTENFQSTGFWPGIWPMPAQVLLGLVVLEFGLYWAHRLGHEWMLFWRFHALHHSSVRLWFFNTGRFHFVDTIKSMLFGMPILILAGAPGVVFFWGSSITAFIGILTHCNVQMRFGWLNYVFNTPVLHRWHHSMDLREGNKNYGENLVCWDLLFGTFFDDAERRPPAEIGIKEAMPRTFYQQLAAPFIWKRYQQRASAERSASQA